MKKTINCVIIGLALLLSAVAFSQTRIMPLGDSITGSPGCWRAFLWNDLQDAGYTDIDFVGSLPGQGCGLSYDGDNEGHGGFLAINIANGNQLPPWLNSANPDIVMMHLGTNDVWSSLNTDNIISAFTTLLNQMRDNNPNIILLVAQIIPMDANRSCGTCDTGVIALNEAIQPWAASMSTSQSPVIVVDQWSGFYTDSDTYDGVHPNDAGDMKIASNWLFALSEVLEGDIVTPTAIPSLPPTPTPEPPPTLGPSPTPQPAGNCEFVVTNNWGSGFTGEIVISNSGNSVINGWNVSWSFSDGTRISNVWNAVLSGSNPYSAGNMGWNSSIQPGASVSFGFLGSSSGDIALPLVSGSVCE